MKTGYTTIIGRTLSTVMTVAMLLGVAPASTSKAEFFVTSVIREVTLKQADTQYKDYYINAGTNNGLKKGVFVDATRKIGVFDNINSKLIGDTPVKIARMKVIHIDKNFSVARLVKFYEKETTPLANYDGVMIGDQIQVSESQ